MLHFFVACTKSCINLITILILMIYRPIERGGGNQYVSTLDTMNISSPLFAYVLIRHQNTYSGLPSKRGNIMKNEVFKNKNIAQENYGQQGNSIFTFIIRESQSGRNEFSTIIGFLLCILLPALIMIAISINNPSSSNESNETVELYENWQETGILFPDSDTTLLTEADIDLLFELSDSIDELSPELLIRYCINDLYARHHYLFSTEPFHSFYSNYDWYHGFLNAEDSQNAFNDIERENLNFLVSIEKSLQQ